MSTDKKDLQLSLVRVSNLDKNKLDQVRSPFGGPKTTRLESTSFIGLHSYDHYGQMVVYARANNVVPGNAPADGKGKGKTK